MKSHDTPAPAPPSMPVAARPLRICLILHSTRSDNLGVGALAAAEVEILRSVAKRLGREIAITSMDWKDPRAPYVTGPEIEVRDLDGRTIAKPSGYFAVARASDVVIDIGGGDSFADIYGSRRLMRMFALKYLTHLSGTPLVMAPQTVGPFTRPFSRFLARASMNRAALVAVRDDLSVEAVRKMGVNREVIAASDVALRLPYTAPAPRPLGGPVRVGLNVSGLLMNGGYTGNNQFGLTTDYPTLIRDLIGYFQNHATPCEVHLVPHVLPPAPAPASEMMRAEDDYAASEALTRQIPGLVLAPRFTAPPEAKSYIAGLDFFAGARMHACIAAFSSGVPVVPMAYSRKFRGLFGTLGYNRTVECTTQSNAEILTALTAAFEDRETLRAEGQAARARGHARLQRYESALADLLAGLG